MGYYYHRKTPPPFTIELIEGGYWVKFIVKRNGEQTILKHKQFHFRQYDHDPIKTKKAAKTWAAYWAPRLKKPIKTT